MANWKIILVFIFSAPNLLVAQDWNWYIGQGKGVSGIPGSDSAQYIHTIHTDIIRIHGESPASSDTLARNDVFIIFNDGSCYSSRLHPRIQNNGGSQVFSSFEGDDVYIHTSGKNARYLYWTNVYDTDDPPPQGFNVSAVQTSGDVSNTVQVGSMQVDSMFAHQDIVAGKDIILVLPPSNEERLLLYNIVEGSQTEVLQMNPNIFPNSRHVFGASYQMRSDTILIKDSASPVYVAFKVQTMPDTSLLDKLHSWQLYEAQSGTLLQEHVEPIRIGHDPNFVYLYNVCKMDGDIYASYMVHFYNDGTAPVRTVDFSFRMPDDFFRVRPSGSTSLGGRFGSEDYRCENLFYRLSGTSISRWLRPARVTYTYRKESADLLPGRMPSRQAEDIVSVRQGATGYFLICLKLPSERFRGIPADITYQHLKLQEPMVYFDGNGFNIRTFVPQADRNIKKNIIKFAENCKPCACGSAHVPGEYLSFD